MQRTTHKLDAHVGHTCTSHTSMLVSEIMPFIQHVCVSICFTHKHSTVNSEKGLGCLFSLSSFKLLCFSFSTFFVFFPGCGRSFADCSGELSQSKYLNLGTRFKALSSFLTRAVVKAASLRQAAAEIIRNNVDMNTCVFSGFLEGDVMRHLVYISDNGAYYWIYGAFKVFWCSFLSKMLLPAELLLTYDWLIAVWGAGFS